MNSMLKAFYTKPLIIYLVAALLVISTFAGPAEAMFVPAAPQQSSATAPAASVDRTTDLTKIKAALESKIIQQKLMDYGLTPEETMVRVSKLSDEQIHQLAIHTDQLQAGAGSDTNTLIIILIIILLVVLIILIVEAPQHRTVANA